MNRIFKRFSNFTQFKRPYFGNSNMAQLYYTSKIESHIRNFKYISFGFAVMNICLTVFEYMEPIFGSISYYSFILMATLGTSFYCLIFIYSSRTIKTLDLSKCGKFINVTVFKNNLNEFNINIKDISNLRNGRLGFYKFDIVDKGTYFINLELNDLKNNQINTEYITSILKGKELPINNIEKKVKKFN